MKFNQYMQKKDSAKINEGKNSRAINEASGETDFMAMIMSAVSYAKASAMLPGYKEAALAADTELNIAKVGAKTLTITKRIKALELKKANLPNNKKEAIIDQIEKLKDAVANLGDQAEARQNALSDAATNIKTDLDSEVKKIEGGLGDLISKKMTAISQEAKQAGLEAKEKVAKATGKDKRADAAANELDLLKQKHEETLKKIEAGEASSEDELKEVDGIDAVQTELINYLNVSKSMNTVKATLNRLHSEADALSSNIADSFDTDQFIRGLSEEDNFNLFEDEDDKKSVSPDEVRGKIMAGDEDEYKTKLTLMGSLEKAIASWETALKAQADAKNEIWKKVEGKPTTKSVLRIAGADMDSIKEESDGTFTATKLSPKWEALIGNTDDSPLKKIAETKKKIADENIPALKADEERLKDKEPAAKPAEKTPTSGTGPQNTPTSGTGPQNTPTSGTGPQNTPTSGTGPVKKELTPEEKKTKIAGLSAKLNDPNMSDENKNKIRNRIKELEKDNNSETFDSEYLAISEEIDSLLSATSSSKIMKFSDFLASRSN